MDAFGFAYASAFLAIVLAIFGIVGRILNGVASELRWGLAPALVDGFKAWGGELRVARRSSSDGASPDDAGGPDVDTVTDPRDPGLVVPVQAVSRRGWHLFARGATRSKQGCTDLTPTCPRPAYRAELEAAHRPPGGWALTPTAPRAA